MLKQRFYYLLIGLLLSLHLTAQPTEQPVKVLVAPNKVDWTYQVGEKVKFVVTVFKNGNPLSNLDVRYEIGPEKLTPTEKGTKKTTSNGTLTLETTGAKTAGFIRCSAWVVVDGKEYRGFATAGFSPEKIQPTVQDPSDFDAYWNTALQELAKSPMDARMTLLPERCTEKVDVYHVNLQNVRGARIYGILSKPKKPGKYPALLHVPGAGVRGYNGDIANAEKGIITFQIGIHGIPVTMAPSVYEDLAKGPLYQYMTFNLDSKENFYFRRVFLGCIRANDFITSLPEFDGTNLAVTGGSQGGALSIVTAALDKRVKWLAALYPAYSDVTGYLHNRAGGWPHYFLGANAALHNTPAKLQTIGYFDVVNFARRVTIPGYYTWGYNDETCPPTSMYASYNVIPGPKELHLALDTGHWSYPEQREKLTNWVTQKLLTP